MRTRQQDVFKTPSTSLSVSASRIFLSAKLLCKCSAQTLAHSQFMLIACTPITPNLFPASLFFILFFFLLPQTVILNPPPKKNNKKRGFKIVFIIPFHTLLMVCAFWYVWSSVWLPGQAVIYLVGDILYAVCNILLHLVILSMYGNKRQCCAGCVMSTYWKLGSK